MSKNNPLNDDRCNNFKDFAESICIPPTVPDNVPRVPVAGAPLYGGCVSGLTRAEIFSGVLLTTPLGPGGGLTGELRDCPEHYRR